MIDWDLAVTTGTRLVRPGPAIGRDEARAAVAELRRHAAAARGHVRAHTGLIAPDDDTAVAVIDRPGWVRANAGGFRVLLEPVVAKLAQRRSRGPQGALGNAVGPRVTAVEMGGILAFLAGKVLGQYELFPPFGADEPQPRGRLLLVAPNVVATEREMGVDPADFRLWVCLHEETHRVQFGAVPWLRAHLLAEVQGFLEETDVEPTAVLRRLGAALGAVGDAVRGGDGVSLLEAVQTPEQREVLERLTAVMSLLEGHADVVMDDVGPQVVPSVDVIRERFQRRRASATRPEQVLRRLIGMDAKMRQYRDGARFVRTVTDRVGMAGFNAVWTSPDTLPRPAELLDPEAWVRRVHGPPALGAAGVGA